MTVRFAVIGGGPAGVRAASTAARLGAEVTLVEADVVGGAANLWDCIPSKAMIATGGLVTRTRRAQLLGLGPLHPEVDLAALRTRVGEIERRLETSWTRQLESQGVRIVRGTGRLAGPHLVEVEALPDASGEAGAGASSPGPEGELVSAEAVLIATGSSPRIPAWAELDGERVLSTRQAYPPPEVPEHLVVIGSGVTGVEFVHMFASLGSA
ncbi:MAG: FAD-dependent oxidoreductase, partial [Acidimicrobiales bacterium]